MDSDDDSDDVGEEWDQLETITKFDGLRANGANASTELVTNGLHSRVAAKASTPVSLLVESLVQQLCSLLEADPQRSQDLYHKICQRLHAINLIDETYAMGEFEMMRSQYQKALYQLVSIARGENLPVEVLENIWPLQPSVGLDWSRYHREFSEMDFIAGGGFGKVYRAKNNLDGIVYAVKKITIQATTIKNVLVHLAEVKTLASLNHINIVPYKAAWLEPLIATGAGVDGRGSEKESGQDTSSLEEEEEEEEVEESSNGLLFSLTSGLQSKSRRKSTLNDSLKRDDDTDDFSIHFEDSQEENSTRSDNQRQVAELEDARGSVFSIEESQPHVKLKWATLYIQMTLCHLTLREWLDDRNRFDCFEQFYAGFIRRPPKECPTSAIPKNSFCRQTSLLSGDAAVEPLQPTTSNLPSPTSQEVNNSPQHLDVVTDVLNQLLNGLTYIHSRGIVHHDIKPSNIFVSVSDYDRSISIQLGDFGLACPLQSSHTGAGFGTPLYAAPEQLEGKCDPKSDIYSLGIILLELLIAFDTDMERADMIKQARKSMFPADLDVEYRDLLKNLLSTRPSKRPDTFALTEAVNCMKLNRDRVISELRKSLSDQEVQILTLKQQIDQQNRQRQDSQDEMTQLEERTNETLIVKEQELIFKTMEIESKTQQLHSKEQEIRTKDAEIDRLKQLLKTYQEKDSFSTDEANE